MTAERRPAPVAHLISRADAEDAYPLMEEFPEWPVGPKRVLIEVRSIGKGPDGEPTETFERLVFAPEDGFDRFRMGQEAEDLVTRAQNAWAERLKEGTRGE